MDLRGIDVGEELPDDFKATIQAELESVQRSISQSMGRAMIFPEQPVEIGDSWTQSMPINTDFGSVDVTVTYTLREVTSEGLVIEIHGTDSLNQVNTSDPGIGMLAEQTEIDMTLIQDGEMVLDPETFWFTRQQIELVLEGTITQRMVSPMDARTSENATPEPASPDGPSMKTPMKQTVMLDLQVQK